jgi:ferredoxin
MADRTNKSPGNAPGTYYVDDNCIDCDFCRETAPSIFRRNDAAGLSLVHHQPVTEEEIAMAEEALAGCPADTIGNDGVE